MSEHVAKSEAAPGRDGWKLILSSGLAAALLGIWGTLAGLMYRVGWLGVFGVSPELFLPSSATELTFWAYLGLMETWSGMRASAVAAVARIFLLVVGAIAIGAIAAVVAAKYGGKLKALRTQAWRLPAGLFAGIAFATAAPFVILFIAALLLAPPLPAYSAGAASAARAISTYKVNQAHGKGFCDVIMGTSGKIGACPMVLAQTTERIAYLDGDVVHVIPAEGLRISWKLPQKAAVSP